MSDQPRDLTGMNLDEVAAAIEADEASEQKVATPVQYSHMRPISSPQVYGYIRRGRLKMYYCLCGRKVIKIAEADELLRELGKLPPLLEDEDLSEDDRIAEETGYYEDRDSTGRAERAEEDDA